MRTVVEFASEMATLFVWSAPETPGKIANVLGLMKNIGVALFEFLGTGADFGFEVLRRTAQASNLGT